MQTQHLIIIAIGQLVGLALLAYFIRRAFLRALARATADDRDQIHALNNDLARAVEAREELKQQLADHNTRQRQLKAQPFKVMTISTLDLKDVLAELEKLVTRQDPARPIAPLVGWADPEKIQQMRQGQRRYLTVSRKKGETFTQQVCASSAQQVSGNTKEAA
ncbi:hypothetical protein [Pseudomonas saponiphila]|uniref:hypothetical protein n=1 Tax=Pseudomonas saponiphila TaxID=556534 RepID=UPI002240B6FB|nr:hypothetical protein [Pseudomonas saponiphila]